MSSGPNVSSASLLGIYILLELGKKLRIVLSGDYRFFVLVSRNPSLVKFDQLLILAVGNDLSTLFLVLYAVIPLNHLHIDLPRFLLVLGLLATRLFPYS